MVTLIAGSRALGRSHTTIGREIRRCGGRRRYRARFADAEAWLRARRPMPTKLERCPDKIGDMNQLAALRAVSP